jgi:ribosomal protein S18 acetylase RimI-like enzyme
LNGINRQERVKVGKTLARATSGRGWPASRLGRVRAQAVALYLNCCTYRESIHLEIRIDNIQPEDINEAGLMVRMVFDRFVAPDYPLKGIGLFYEIISEKKISERLSAGSMIHLAKCNDSIVGLIEISGSSHVYLLYVKNEYQRMGVARMLLDKSISVVKKTDPAPAFLTVNSVFSAAGFYEKYGFQKISDYQLKDGILTCPMKIYLQ